LDNDNSVESRSFATSFTTSSYFTIVKHLNTTSDIDRVLEDGEAKMVLVIPLNFGNKILTGQTVQVQTLADGADANTASIAGGYASGIVAAYSQKILLDAQQKLATPIKTASINAETRVWYNPDLKSKRFFVPGIMGLIILMTTVIASSTSIVKEREVGTLEQLIVSPIKPYQIIIGKLAPFSITASITLMNLLIVAAIVFDVRMRGNIFLFFSLTMIFLITILGLGLFISTISKTQQQASFTTGFFVLPPFLFLSGYSFPIENMPAWLQPFTYLIPLRYFLVIIRGIFLKGIGLAELWPSLVALLACGVVIFTASFLRFKKNLE
jgi:ABC-2 type transport system permease protein